MLQTASFDFRQGNYPNLGELWKCLGRTAVIAGNSVSENGCIWVMDWDSGSTLYARSEILFIHPDRKTVTNSALEAKFTSWAEEGIDDAMWFLASWFEGKNHARSTWYYIAALRANWERFGWAYSRILSDARSAYMCKDVPPPDLTFLETIPEFAERRLLRHAWKVAVEEANNAIVTTAKQLNDGQ